MLLHRFLSSYILGGVTVIKKLNSIIYTLLYKLGYVVKKIIINEDELIDLIRILRPISTEYNLIRVGGPNDGGYLIPDDLEGIKYCFSPGVSTVADFELQLSKLGINSYLADYSVENPPVMVENFTFLKKYLGSVNNERYIRLEEWIKTVDKIDENMILQMDIEGFEYEVLADTPREILNRFRIIVIEFHNLDKLFDNFSSQIIKQAFNKLLQDFYVVHIHPNNCCRVRKYKRIKIPELLEFTFIRKDRVRTFEYVKNLPNGLDKKNVLTLKDIKLDKIWYGN